MNDSITIIALVNHFVGLYIESFISLLTHKVSDKLKRWCFDFSCWWKNSGQSLWSHWLLPMSLAVLMISVWRQQMVCHRLVLSTWSHLHLLCIPVLNCLLAAGPSRMSMVVAEIRWSRSNSAVIQQTLCRQSNCQTRRQLILVSSVCSQSLIWSTLVYHHMPALSTTYCRYSLNSCLYCLGYWHQRADERHGNPPPR